VAPQPSSLWQRLERKLRIEKKSTFLWKEFLEFPDISNRIKEIDFSTQSVVQFVATSIKKIVWILDDLSLVNCDHQFLFEISFENLTWCFWFFRSAAAIASYRPKCPIIAVSRFEGVGRSLHLFRGVYPVYYTGEGGPAPYIFIYLLRMLLRVVFHIPF
jgi:Pyruvate kinase, alpha/beta domain